jgi:hypothetical protein
MREMEEQTAIHPLYANDAERIQHESAIRQLSQEYDVQAEIMKNIYEEILGDLKSRARIKVFLSIFVARIIRDLLSSSSSPSLPDFDLQLTEKYRKMLPAT